MWLFSVEPGLVDSCSTCPLCLGQCGLRKEVSKTLLDLARSATRCGPRKRAAPHLSRVIKEITIMAIHFILCALSVMGFDKRRELKL